MLVTILAINSAHSSYFSHSEWMCSGHSRWGFISIQQSTLKCCRHCGLKRHLLMCGIKCSTYSPKKFFSNFWLHKRVFHFLVFQYIFVPYIPYVSNVENHPLQFFSKEEKSEFTAISSLDLNCVWEWKFMCGFEGKCEFSNQIRQSLAGLVVVVIISRRELTLTQYLLTHSLP